MPNETIEASKQFDYLLPREIERKFVPYHPEDFVALKYHETARGIEQVYLSTPDEPYSLRLRATIGAGGTEYEATLKDRGELQPCGINRLEVTTAIPPELYAFYTKDDLPAVHKVRAEPMESIVVDFYEDGSIQIESEDDDKWRIFSEHFAKNMIEVTGLPDGDNERRAFKEVAFESSQNLDSSLIIEEILAAKSGDVSPITVHIGGRSGSGKSTVVREISALLDTHGISNQTLSTDDYHRGETWLRRHNNGLAWQHWDDPIVYDTMAMKQDLERLKSGGQVAKRTIDWRIVEPFYESALLPAEVLIIEGIYATAPEIMAPESLVYELSTPLATCIGRRLLRDMKERQQFADPVKSLLYMLSDVEPAYRKQREQATR